MKKLTVRARIVLGFSSVLAIIMGLGMFAQLRLSEIRTDADVLTTDALAGLYYTTEIEGALKQHLVLAFGIQADQDPIGRQSRQRALTDQTAAVISLIQKHESTMTTEADRELFVPLEKAWNDYAGTVDEWLRAGNAGPAEAEARAAVERTFAAVTLVAERLVEFDRQHGTEAGQAILSEVDDASRALWVGLAVTLVLAAFSGFSLFRAITRPLNEVIGALNVVSTGDLSRKLATGRADEFGVVADGFNRMSSDLTALIGRVQSSGVQVGTSVVEIAATARQHQATANEVAATITEIGATSSEISATSRELARTMKEVMQSADQTASLATNGQQGLGRMEETMRHIADASSSINAKLTVLNEKASNIGTMVTTITKVADQTNLLSLNAAIEAEKAGEYGRGFAVVATEIRRLADQTAVATYDIEQMVKEIQSATSAGVMGMDKFSEEVRRGVDVVRQVADQLGQIIQHVQALTPTFESVNEGMQSQAVGAQQISEALSQLTEGAQQTVESLRQSTSALEQLNTAARDLQAGVSRFTLAA